MLDECKGERLEEVLAVFSNAVLKHVVAQNSDSRDAVAQKLALEKFSYTGVPDSLSTLVLAHQFSLKKTLERKDQARKQYTDFSELMSLKGKHLTTRHEQLKAAIEVDESTEFISKAETYALQDRVRKNWYGSNEWLESVMHGDGRYEDDGLLTRQFGTVWKKVESGHLDEIVGKRRNGLLEQLDARVREQSERLKKWQSFGEQMKAQKKPMKEDAVAKKEPANLVLKFADHESLQLPKSSDKAKVWEPKAENADLLERLQQELSSIGKPKQAAKTLRKIPDYSRDVRSPSPEPVYEADVVMEDVGVYEPTQERGGNAASIDLEHDEPEENEGEHNGMDLDEPEHAEEAKSSEEGSWEAVEAEQVSDLEAIPEIETPPRRASPPILTRAVASPVRPDSPPSPAAATFTFNVVDNSMPPPPVPSRQTRPRRERQSLSVPTNFDQPPSPEEDAAAAILKSMAAASPSPVKQRHVLSLAERTKMSMSRASLGRNLLRPLDDFHDVPDVPSVPPTPNPRIRLSSAEDHDMTDDVKATAEAEEKRRSEALVERTRASMANIDALTKAAQVQRRKSIKTAAKKKRESFRPNQPLYEEELTQDLDRLRLIEDESVDYEDVFRSRPKIKSSPGVSPARAWRRLGSMGREGSLSPV